MLEARLNVEILKGIKLLLLMFEYFVFIELNPERILTSQCETKCFMND